MTLLFTGLGHLALASSFVDPEMDISLAVVRPSASITTCDHSYSRTGRQGGTERGSGDPEKL